MPSDVYEPFNQDVERYGAYQYTAARRSSLRANRRFSDVIIQAAQLDGKRVVDVGCGDGTYTKVLRAETRAAFILGVDPAARAIETAGQADTPVPPGLAFQVGVASDLLRAGQHFDVAIYRGVIHHVGDPAYEIATALQLAEAVFFLEPNGLNPVLKLLERFSPYHRAHREQSYALSQYRRWIEAAGGRVTAGFYFGLVPMFCPDWFVPLAVGLEPVIERLPLVRPLMCGQVGILAARAGQA